MKAEPLNGPFDGGIFKSDIDPDFEDDVTTLRNFSVISVSEDGNSFTMHRIVQLAIRAWLKSHGELDR